MDVVARHNITVSGPENGRPLVFAHGFGCDQHMWRHVAPAFEDTHRVVRFDFVGAGGSTVPYDPDRYATLDGYAADVLEVIRGLGLRDAVFVGHSVSAMIGALAQVEAPDLFDRLVMVGPSPRYIDDDAYVGGFDEPAIHGLLDALRSNYLGWSATMAPLIVGNADRPALGEELTESFCRMDPAAAEGFARATFLSDHRDVLSRISAPTLVIQCRDDLIAPVSVGEYVAATVPDAELVVLDATGHCPNLSAPGETIDAIATFLRLRSAA
ncbi:MAG TPA: alpha/beta hydrolase [Nocardioides sp.]|nr:alpha/beta hydrolase [Nocardioides sp.]